MNVQSLEQTDVYKNVKVREDEGSLLVWLGFNIILLGYQPQQRPSRELKQQYYCDRSKRTCET